MRFEVDVQPMGAAFPRDLGRTPHQVAGDAAMAGVRMNDGVEEEGMKPPSQATFTNPTNRWSS
jgi:hypothetical protein